MITLKANCGYNERFVPEGAKKPYIARIKGRDKKMTFSREFIGKTEAIVDEPGLYEVRDVDKKGRPDDSYCLILEVDGRLRRSVWYYKDAAMEVAKLLDSGRPIGEIVYLRGCPSSSDPNIVEWEYELVKPRQTEQRQKEQTVDSAVDACWKILSNLPPSDALEAIARMQGMTSQRTAGTDVGAGGAIQRD